MHHRADADRPHEGHEQARRVPDRAGGERAAFEPHRVIPAEIGQHVKDRDTDTAATDDDDARVRAHGDLRFAIPEPTLPGKGPGELYGWDKIR